MSFIGRSWADIEDSDGDGGDEVFDLWNDLQNEALRIWNWIDSPAEAPAAGAPPAEAPEPEPEPGRVLRRPKLQGQAMRIAVYGGAWHSTGGGLKKEDMKLKVGSSRIISKKMSLAARRRYDGSSLHRWNMAVIAARANLLRHCDGRFVPVGGKTELGQRLLRLTRAHYADMLEEAPSFWRR